MSLKSKTELLSVGSVPAGAGRETGPRVPFYSGGPCLGRMRVQGPIIQAPCKSVSASCLFTFRARHKPGPKIKTPFLKEATKLTLPGHESREGNKLWPLLAIFHQDMHEVVVRNVKC